MAKGIHMLDIDPQRTVTEKVRMAAEYYRQRHKTNPTICLVHPSVGSVEETSVEGVEVRNDSVHTLRAGHLWIGDHDPRN